MRGLWGISAVVIAALTAALLAVSTPLAQTPPPAPSAPLLLVRGGAVVVAWRLPPQPRPVTIVLYRREVGGTLARVGEYPAEQLTVVDKEVRQGKSYEYALAAAYRKGPVSVISHTAAVSVGGGSRVTLVGGSLTRAVFEVTLFEEGRKLTAQFVHGPGEAIGDMSYVTELGRSVDFRLGARLSALEVADVSGVRPSRESVGDIADKMMTDLAGRKLELDFKFPGETREVLRAQVQTKDGKTVTLAQGDSLDG